MAIESKPDEIPEFALLNQNDPVTGEANVAEPPTAKKNYGWAYLEKPGHNWFNWLHRKTSEWLTYFNQFHSESEFIINTQADFNSAITRVSANDYKLDDDALTSVFMPLSGGFQMSGALSGGDTWGRIQTNNCKSIDFKGGAFIDFENENGYLEVNTDDCYLRNVEIKGTGTVAAGILRSYLLNAYKVTFDNCKCNTRLSSLDMVGFQGSGTALHNITSKYINCIAYDLDGSDKVHGFKDCMNLTNCGAYQLDSTGGADNCCGFMQTNQISACYAYNIDSDSGDAYGFNLCNQLSACNADNIDSDSGDASGFYSCNQLSGCNVNDIDSGSGTANGYHLCVQLSACYAYDVDSASVTANGFYQCNRMSGCCADKITAIASSGFYSCDQSSACYAYDIESTSGAAYGFYDCEQISACRAYNVDSDSGNAYGFNLCDRISACYANDIDSASGTANGFNSCTYGASLYTTEALNAANDWVDTDDAQITNKFSTGAFWT